VVAAGSPGVTITPADCGVSTLTCSLTVMPANGPGGTVNLTVAAVDGANRSASSSIAVSVTGNQSAPTNATPATPAGGGGGGGGSLDWWVISGLLLVAGPRLRQRVARCVAGGRQGLPAEQGPSWFRYRTCQTLRRA
jgi:hypothetical protein